MLRPRDNRTVHRIEWLYQDDMLLAVDKPAGLLSVPGRGEANRECVAARVQAAMADALVVHRLDQATSGVMLFGRGADVQRALSMAFAERRVAKRYEAIVHGQVQGDRGEIDLPLLTDWPNRPRQMVDHQSGKPSLTRWCVLSRDAAADTTRLQLEPVTGRSHQLRVHLAAIGHAIVGDTLYAPTVTASRLMLHACELRLPHPADARTLIIVSPLPF
jgi:tRNA pseudouridine32 synthase / 23S rRNA pseudouridine746 synthase